MSPQEYIDVVRKDPKAAMIPIGVVQKILDLSRSAVIDRIKARELVGVRVEVDDSIYRGVTFASLLAYERAHPKPPSDEVLIAKIEKIIADKFRTTGSSKPEDFTLTYGAVMRPLGMSWRNPRDRQMIGRLLGVMSKESATDRKRGFMVSAVVVRKVTGEPGPGFYDLARELDLLDDDDDKEVFWKEQLKAARNFYQRDKN
jgi:hypothetical protein